MMAVVGAVQASSCSFKPIPYGPPVTSSTSTPASHSGTGFAKCPQHFPTAPPAVGSPGRQRELCFEAYAVLYSGQSKTPVYTVQGLTRSSVTAATGLPRSDRFYPEARLPIADRAQLEDYRNSGYDRGHVAPAGDMPTIAAKDQSFSLANMVPQTPALNQGPWNQIEQATRKYALRAPGDVYVFTGPYFSAAPTTIGLGKVWVPSHTWKLVYTPGNGRAWAYWMTNNTSDQQSLKPISYQMLTSKLGTALLPPGTYTQ